MNKLQKELRNVYGTPREFAKACRSAIGTISITEAEDAIQKYNHHWSVAGKYKMRSKKKYAIHS